MAALTFFVPGVPVAQGSKKSLGPGRPWIEANKDRLMPWRDSVAHAARAAWGQWEADDWLFPGPVRLDLVFSFPRPKSHYRTGSHAGELRADAPLWKTSAPDLSKLVRAVEDAITIAGIWRDDAQVAQLHAVKQYAHTPGLAVTIEDPPALPVAAVVVAEPEPQDALL